MLHQLPNLQILDLMRGGRTADTTWHLAAKNGRSSFTAPDDLLQVSHADTMPIDGASAVCACLQPTAAYCKTSWMPKDHAGLSTSRCAVPQVLQGCRHLRRATLSDASNLTDAGLTAAARWGSPWLERFTVVARDSACSAAAVAALRAALPTGCSVCVHIW